ALDDPVVAELGHAVRALPERQPVDDEREPEALAEMHVQQVLGAQAEAVPGLGERHRPDVVLRHRRAAERLLEPFGDRYVAPAEREGVQGAPAVRVDRPGYRDPGA